MYHVALTVRLQMTLVLNKGYADMVKYFLFDLSIRTLEVTIISIVSFLIT